MNPYEAPLSDPQEDRTDPDFRVINAIPRGTIWMFFGFMAICCGSYVYFSYAYMRSSRSHRGFLQPGTMGLVIASQIFSPLSMILQNGQNSRKIRNHPLIRGGHALYGGIGALGKGLKHLRGGSRGILVISRDSVIFSSLATGEQTTVPLREIEGIEVRRHLLLYRVLLDLRLASGAVMTFTVPRARVWKKLIEQARAVAAASPLV